MLIVLYAVRCLIKMRFDLNDPAYYSIGCDDTFKERKKERERIQKDIRLNSSFKNDPPDGFHDTLRHKPSTYEENIVKYRRMVDQVNIEQ